MLERVTLRFGDSVDYLRGLKETERPDVVYLDPMYPAKDKVKSLPKKGMMLARRLLDKPTDALPLVAACRDYARYKVVLKRPKHDESKDSGPPILEPSTVYQSPNTRFEVYTTNSTATIAATAKLAES